MRNHRSDVVATAMRVLDDYGLADLSMRRLASELGVRPSALYHHVANKQTLLALVADELLARARPPGQPGPDDAWDDQVVAACHWLRDALLAWRDGAELVSTVHAFGLGAAAATDVVGRAVAASGLPEETARTATRTLLHFVFGHTLEEQTRIQAASVGAIDDEPAEGSDFGAGLRIVVDGIAVARAAGTTTGRAAAPTQAGAGTEASSRSHS